MSLTHINFAFSGYFAMVLLVTLWNCGFTAITREGKIMHFILQFFTARVNRRSYFDAKGNQKIDDEIFKELQDEINKYNEKRSQAVFERLSKYLEREKIHCDAKTYDIVFNISTRQDCLITNPDYPSLNTYFMFESVRRIPSIISDPIVTCITCMASFHSLLLYTIVCLYLNLTWNPLEWAVIAVPCAFTGEFLWSLKSKIQE